MLNLESSAPRSRGPGGGSTRESEVGVEIL
jgi:hypothetical protein